MSVVIGICGTNFCSLIADGRLVMGDYPNLVVVNEKVMKVFKINDSVLIGGAGWFQGDEEITSPLDIYPDKNSITLTTAVDAIVRYIEKRMGAIATTRNYLVGGKDEVGNYGLYRIQYNATTRDLVVIPQIPQPPHNNFAVACCFPPKIKGRYDEFFSKVCDSITSSQFHDQVIKKTAQVIAEIANIDESVNTNILTLTI